MKIKRLRLHFTGIVQGVGFRPFIYRLATRMQLSGFVCNRPDGVRVEIEGRKRELEQFVEKISNDLPSAAEIKSFTSEDITPEEMTPEELGKGNAFRVLESPEEGLKEITIGADTATCSACLAEMNDPADRRFAYPFINCTNCGPRLTIVNDLPYDRQRTSMAAFPLCPECQIEYDDPENRRFHAEATACPKCGPQLTLCDAQEKKIVAPDILHLTRTLLNEGNIIALKG
ncbi:MAG: carbamoyltransferase HypF, partial [Deltaproteobacteria bacterium]|nr:carbamoyltransferase HypF [Deltaproteobacteria bacterium]